MRHLHRARERKHTDRKHREITQRENTDRKHRPNPALGLQPAGPIIVQRDPIEIAASRLPPISRDVDIQDDERGDVALDESKAS